MNINDLTTEEIYEMLLDNPDDYIVLKLAKLDEHISNPEIKESMTNHFIGLKQYILDNEDKFILEEIIIYEPMEEEDLPILSEGEE